MACFTIRLRITVVPDGNHLVGSNIQGFFLMVLYGIAVLSGCNPPNALEMPRQVALIGESGFERSGSERPSTANQFTCPLDSYLGQIRVRRQPEFPLKDTDEMKGAQVGYRGNLSE